MARASGPGKSLAPEVKPVAQVSPARKVAFEILVQVEAGHAFAANLLEGGKASALGEADRGLATEIVMGVLRWRGEIDYRLEQLSGKPIGSFDREVATALRMGVYQIAFLEKIPKSAAVNESVKLTKLARKRSAAGLVNAVLRKCEPARIQAAPANAEGLSATALESFRRTVPSWLLNRWEKTYGRDAAAQLACVSTQIPSTTLRITSLSRDLALIPKKLDEKGVKVRQGRYAPAALIVEQGKGMSSEAAWKMGMVIQDEASQLVASLLAVRPGLRVLDLAAAPGLKTSLLADALGKGLLVACDISSVRLRTMRKLLPRMTANPRATRMVQLDASQDLPFRQKFDRILVDAPCSGTGTLGRNPEIKWRLTPEDIERLSTLQVRILRNALGLLATGGRLVYATCSLEPEENASVVETVLPGMPGCRLLTRRELSEEFPKLRALFEAQGYFHTRPDRDDMDGFFAAVIVR
ncbi:MAG: 16S rRNA (cytosine(967)-C(5))-methyltransferase RsmB [Acidobacteria bacterium]|nr:16S rRNA (cytosine(967)-C(5))-methyltransferase RsmB [Acidobacteriota bacterium]